MTTRLETGPRHARKRPRRATYQPLPFEDAQQLLELVRAQTTTLPTWTVALVVGSGLLGTFSGWATYFLHR